MLIIGARGEQAGGGWPRPFVPSQERWRVSLILAKDLAKATTTRQELETACCICPPRDSTCGGTPGRSVAGSASSLQHLVLLVSLIHVARYCLRCVDLDFDDVAGIIGACPHAAKNATPMLPWSLATFLTTFSSPMSTVRAVVARSRSRTPQGSTSAWR